MRKAMPRGLPFVEPRTLGEQGLVNEVLDRRLKAMEDLLDTLAVAPVVVGDAGWTMGANPNQRYTTCTWDGAAWRLDTTDTYVTGAANWIVTVNGNTVYASRVEEVGANSILIRDWQGNLIPGDSEVEMRYLVEG